MRTLAIAGERAPLGPAGGRTGEWTFAERYPALAMVAARDGSLRRIERHYDAVVQFTRRHVAPYALEFERRVALDPTWVPDEMLREACRAGLFSMMFPKWLGGRGVPFPAVLITYELLAQECLGVANLLGVNGLGIACVMSTFDPRILRLVADRICRGERRGEPVFISTCVTEPGAGSDAEDPDEFTSARLRTLARRVSGGWRIQGTKVFISNGALADLHVVAAYTDPRHRPEDLALFLVPANTPGVVVARNERKLGQKICPASEIHFDDAFVPEVMRCRTDEAGSFAWHGMANVLGLTRAGVGAFAAGAAEGAYRRALDYCRTHTWRGEPLDRQQWVRVELAHLARRAQMARAIYTDALLAVSSVGLARFMRAESGLPVPSRLARGAALRRLVQIALDSALSERLFKRMARSQLSSDRDLACALGDVAKVSCSDLAVENAQRAMTLVGKDALRHEVGLEKCLRDARLLQIYEGTNQINMLDFIKRRIERQVGIA